MTEIKILKNELGNYFIDKLQKYTDRAEASNGTVDKITWKAAKKQAGDWAINGGTKYGPCAGAAVGAAVGTAIGVPVAAIGEVITIPVGVVVGAAAGAVAGLGVGAGASFAASGVKYCYQSYQEKQLDEANLISGQLGNDLESIVNKLLQNDKIRGILTRLTERGKEHRVEKIFQDYYKILKKQAIRGRIDLDLAMSKLETKTSIKKAEQPSKLTRFGLFAKSCHCSNRSEEVGNATNYTLNPA